MPGVMAEFSKVVKLREVSLSLVYANNILGPCPMASVNTKLIPVPSLKSST